MRHRYIQVLTILTVRSVRFVYRVGAPVRTGADNVWMIEPLEALMREGYVTKRERGDVVCYGLSPKGVKAMCMPARL